MIEIIPAILAKNYKDLQEKIIKFVDYTDTVQLDICDGFFVSSRSWPFDSQSSFSSSPLEKIINEEEGLPYWEKLDFEFDLMVANASQKFDFFVRLGAKRIIFHLEAEIDKDKFFEFLEGIDAYTRENVQIGLAVNVDTSINELDKFINLFDFIQFMGIKNIGYQGQDFDNRVIKQINDFKLKYPDVTISVDGGVNDLSAPSLIQAGAKRLVVGSFLENNLDIRNTINILQNL